MLSANVCQHHVEGSRSARTGKAVTVNLEHLFAHIEMRKTLLEGLKILPMYRATITFQQTGARKDEAAKGHGTDRNALAREP